MAESFKDSKLQVKELSEIFEAKATFLKDTPAFRFEGGGEGALGF